MYDQLKKERAKQRKEFLLDAVQVQVTKDETYLGYPIELAIEKFGQRTIDRVKKHNKPTEKIGEDGDYYRSHCYVQRINTYGLTFFLVRNKARHQELIGYLTEYGYELASDLYNLQKGKAYCMPSMETINKQISETLKSIQKEKVRLRNFAARAIDAKMDGDIRSFTRLEEHIRETENELEILQERLTALNEEKDAYLISVDRVGTSW